MGEDHSSDSESGMDDSSSSSSQLRKMTVMKLLPTRKIVRSRKSKNLSPRGKSLLQICPEIEIMIEQRLERGSTSRLFQADEPEVIESVKSSVFCCYNIN